MIWFSADYHLSHRNIIKYCDRPFKNVEDMDNRILMNLKKRVRKGDILYFLGDLTFDKDCARDFFESFKSIQIHYIVGNHDNRAVIKLAEDYCVKVSSLMDIKIEEQYITLCHYAMRVWNKSHFNSWQLFGHSHGTLSTVGKQHDVGVDSNNFSPVSFENLLKVMEDKPDNFNYIPPEKRNR